MKKRKTPSAFGIHTDKLYISDPILHFKVDSDKLLVYRRYLGRKIPLLTLFFLLAPFVAAATMGFYHPELHRFIPLSSIDPAYLARHLDDPAVQRTNDVNQIRAYLETLYPYTTPETPLSPADLEKLGIHTILFKNNKQLFKQLEKVLR